MALKERKKRVLPVAAVSALERAGKLKGGKLKGLDDEASARALDMVAALYGNTQFMRCQLARLSKDERVRVLGLGTQEMLAWEQYVREEYTAVYQGFPTRQEVRDTTECILEELGTIHALEIDGELRQKIDRIRRSVSEVIRARDRRFATEEFGGEDVPDYCDQDACHEG